MVRETIQATGIEASVEMMTEFLPFDEARQKLSGCDVIALTYPHSKEASSAALRMALSAGPCVAVTPIALFDEAGDAVYRFAATDAEAIAEGLSMLLADQAKRDAIAATARGWLDARGWTAIGTRLAGMIRGVSAPTDLNPPR